MKFRFIIHTAFAGGLLLSAGATFAGEHGKPHIPPGHLPPAGQCRIWYPGTPPGHQPPPGDCYSLSRHLPRGAWLVSRDRVWLYEDRPEHYYHRYASEHRSEWYDDHNHAGRIYDRRNYPDRHEIHQDVKDVRQARKDVGAKRDQVERNYTELKKDQAELRGDIRSGASRKEIRQDRQEIKDDAGKISASRKDLRQSQNKLDTARQELKDDLHRR